MKILIAGFGSIGRRHFRNLLELGQKDIVLLRSGKSLLDTQELDAFPVETDWDSALAHKPDAIIIATPTSSHLSLALAAAEAGLHIFVEKPIADSLEGIDKLEKALKASGKQLLVGFQYRFHPGLRQMKAALDSGELGKPVQARVHWGEYLPDWHPWEDFRKGYSARKDLGGGVTLTLSHPFDYLHWLLGPVSNLSAMLGENRVLGIEVDEQSQTLLEFANGANGVVQLDYLQKPPAHWLEIQCEQGYVVVDFYTNYFKKYMNAVGELEEFPPDPEFERNTLFLDQTRHFLEMVQGNADPICGLDDGIHALQIALGVLESAKTKARVSLS